MTTRSPCESQVGRDAPSEVEVRVETVKCSGHAQCAVGGEDLYLLDDDGYALPLHRVVSGDLIAQARAGARLCPERAITITEVESGA